MARFDVYRHPDAELRRFTPYLLDVQNDHIRSVDTRVVLPLRAASLSGPPMRDLNPIFEVNGTAVVLDTPAIAAFPAAELRQPVLSLKPHSDLIIGALDTLFGSY